MAALAKIEAKPGTATEKYLRSDRDIIAGTYDHILRPVPANTIYTASDKHGKVLFFVYPKAIQRLYNKETAARIKQDITDLAYYEPPPAPDPERHPLADLWADLMPHIDKNKSPTGVHGVYHFGCWHEQGRTNLPVCYTHDSMQPASYTGGLRDDFTKYTLRVVTHAVAFCHELVDPEMLEEYREVAQYTDRTIQTVEAEPITLRAVLVNPKTDSHVDSQN